MGRNRTVNTRLPANIIKRGKTYCVRVHLDGRDVWRAAGNSLRGAQALLVKLREESERGKLGMPKRCTVTFREYQKEYLAWAQQHKRSAERDQRSIQQLTGRFGDMRLGEITKERVQAYMRDRKDQVAGPTVNREVACLRKLLSHAVESGQIPSNPLFGIKLFKESPARQPALDHDQEKKLLGAASPWLAWLIRLALHTGCRRGEILALRWRHIDLDGRSITVSDSKSGESRRIPLHPAIFDELKRRRGLPDGPVVAMHNGKVPRDYSVCDAFSRARTKAGIKGLRFHDLRHVFASRLLEAGASLPEIAEFLGHKTLIIARRYAHSSWNRMGSLMARMTELDGSGGGTEDADRRA